MTESMNYFYKGQQFTKEEYEQLKERDRQLKHQPDPPNNTKIVYAPQPQYNRRENREQALRRRMLRRYG